jgi:hypothetical protein
VEEPVFDPPAHRTGKASWWSRRDFIKLSFAASSAVVGASLVGSGPKSYRVSAVSSDPDTNKVLDFIRQIQNVEIVGWSENYLRPDLILIGVSDLSNGWGVVVGGD